MCEESITAVRAEGAIGLRGIEDFDVAGFLIVAAIRRVSEEIHPIR